MRRAREATVRLPPSAGLAARTLRDATVHKVTLYTQGGYEFRHLSHLASSHASFHRPVGVA